MSKDESRNGLNRRVFLKGLVTASGAVTASGLITESANAEVPSEPAPGDDSRKSQGYRITPHILEYYEKARF